MIRGTTPTIEFNLPFDTGILVEAFVTFSQNNTVVLDKQLSDFKCHETVLSTRLTQKDTLKFNCHHKVEIQIRARTFAGEALASDIITVNVDRILRDGEI